MASQMEMEGRSYCRSARPLTMVENVGSRGREVDGERRFVPP
jgi:hypothetical protein